VASGAADIGVVGEVPIEDPEPGLGGAAEAWWWVLGEAAGVAIESEDAHQRERRAMLAIGASLWFGVERPNPIGGPLFGLARRRLSVAHLSEPAHSSNSRGAPGVNCKRLRAMLSARRGIPREFLAEILHLRGAERTV
jgi:hypothetical protein